MTTTFTMPVAFIEALSNVETESDLLTVCARWIPEIIGVGRASINLRDGDHYRVLTLHGYGLVPETFVPTGTSLTARICRTGKAEFLVAPDHKGSPIVRLLFDAGFRSAIMAPLVVGSEVMGTLNLSSYDVLTDDDLTRAKALGRWIGSQILIRKYAADMKRLALSDPMTGLPNRRSFMTTAETAFAEFLDSGTPLAAVLYDIDHFKTINDRFGHQAGDVVLAECSNRVTVVLPESATCGRIGGEEFAILLPGHSTPDANRLAEICRAAISDRPIVVGRHPIPVTASFGCDAARPGDVAIDDFLRRADNALYAAKAAGRNRVMDAA